MHEERGHYYHTVKVTPSSGLQPPEKATITVPKTKAVVSKQNRYMFPEGTKSEASRPQPAALGVEVEVVADLRCRKREFYTQIPKEPRP